MAKKKKIEATVTVKKFTDEWGEPMVSLVLFVPTEVARKQGLDKDSQLDTWLGIHWYKGLFEGTCDCEPQEVENGITWTTSFSEKQFGRYQDEEEVVYPVKLVSKGFVAIDFDRYHKEDMRPMYLYKFNATRLLDVEGYVYAHSKREAEELIKDSPKDVRRMIGKFPALESDDYDREGWRIDLKTADGYTPKACDVVLGYSEEG